MVSRISSTLMALLLVSVPVVGSAQPLPGSSSSAARADLAHRHDGASAHFDDAEFSQDQLSRVRNLEVELMCACPREKWSRTLSNCPDGCADPQKGEIRAMVLRGDEDGQIYSWMIQKYGPQVRSTPPGIWAHISRLLPIAIFGLCALLGLSAVSRWRRRGDQEDRSQAGLDSLVTDEDRAEIERELEELS